MKRSKIPMRRKSNDRMNDATLFLCENRIGIDGSEGENQVRGSVESWNEQCSRTLLLYVG